MKRVAKKVIVPLLERNGYLLTRDKLSPHDRAVQRITTALLPHMTGVIHIGAHQGEERDVYASHSLPVKWFEADPEHFSELEKNLKPLPLQTGYLAALGDKNGKRNFFCYDDNGFSSSFLQMHPQAGESNVYRIAKVKQLEETRLDSLFSANELDGYDFWVIDCQGYESEVIEGAGGLIANCRALLVEASTRNLYSDAKDFDFLKAKLEKRGFTCILPIPENSVTDGIFLRI